MANLLMKIKHIIIGTFNNIFKRNKEIANSRLSVCKRCKEKKYIFKIGYICKQCGCILKSKTTIKDEECPLAKW